VSLARKLKIESIRKKEKWNLLARENKLEKQLLIGPRIELVANKQIVVEGCLGVLEYNENYLKLRLSSTALILQGENFDVVSFSDQSILVKGKINSLEFDI
jgi:sporulation protein YqfC